jgi:hypothetical protein
MSISTPIDGGLLKLWLIWRHKASNPLHATVEIDVLNPAPFNACCRRPTVRVR